MKGNLQDKHHPENRPLVDVVLEIKAIHLQIRKISKQTSAQPVNEVFLHSPIRTEGRGSENRIPEWYSVIPQKVGRPCRTQEGGAWG